MKTAEEFEMSGDFDSYQEMMIAFAQEHVTLALSKAAEEAKITKAHKTEEGVWEVGVKRVDKQSILNCYPIELIQ